MEFLGLNSICANVNEVEESSPVFVPAFRAQQVSEVPFTIDQSELAAIPPVAMEQRPKTTLSLFVKAL